MNVLNTLRELSIDNNVRITFFRVDTNSDKYHDIRRIAPDGNSYTMHSEMDSNAFAHLFISRPDVDTVTDAFYKALDSVREKEMGSDEISFHYITK